MKPLLGTLPEFAETFDSQSVLEIIKGEMDYYETIGYDDFGTLASDIQKALSQFVNENYISKKLLAERGKANTVGC